MRFKTFLLILSALMLCSCMGAATQQDLQAVYSRINHNEEQIRTLNSQVGVEGSVVPGQAQMWSQMQSMRQDINMVRGQLEDLNLRSNGPDANGLEARIAQLEANIRRMAAELAIDMDSLGPVDSGMQQNAPETPAESSPQATGNQQVATMAPLENNSGKTATQSAPAGVIVGTGQSRTVSAPPLQADNSLAQTLYNSGAKAFSDSKYADAVKIFSDFVNTYPAHKLTSNAYFWQGESHYMMKNYSNAISAYQKVIQDFPGSGKLQASMYKQGLSMFYIDQKPAAKIRLQDLIKKYPKSPEAQRAQKFIEKNLQ